MNYEKLKNLLVYNNIYNINYSRMNNPNNQKKILPNTTNFSEFLKKTETINKTNNNLIKVYDDKDKVVIDKIKESIEREMTDEPEDNKVQIMTFSSENNKEENKLYTYYCALCGANVIVTDSPLEVMKHRKTDDSIIVLASKIFFKNYMKKDKLVVIKRDLNKYEKQFRYICQECGVFVAYQCDDFEEQDSLDELKRRSQKIFASNRKRIMYILIDALVCDSRQSSLYIEMEKIKEMQANKMSFIRLKKTEIDENGKEKEKIVYL